VDDAAEEARKYTGKGWAQSTDQREDAMTHEGYRDEEDMLESLYCQSYQEYRKMVRRGVGSSDLAIVEGELRAMRQRLDELDAERAT
jgi:hypothetical protein